MAVKIDPVTLEVVRNALPAVANEMAADLHRTSYNMMIYEVRDFCTALVLPDGDLVSQNVGGVSHFVADLGVIIKDGMAQWGQDGFVPEDVLITNHQRVAGQHLNNVVIYMPYFFQGELLMFSVVRAHWIDVGGMSTGFGGGSGVPDPWLEGLQLDQLKVYEAGKPNTTLLKILRDNIRFPDSSLGDMRSQMAACRLALRRLDELFQKFGRDTMLESIRQIFRETEQRCRTVVATIPDGVYEASAIYDVPSADLHLPIHAKVTVDHGHMTIDLSGCAKEQKLSINARTHAGALVAYKNLTAPLEPVNEGSFAACTVVIPEGNIMMARYPAGMANWSGMIPTVVDTIITALAPAIPDRIPAAHHGLLGGSVVFFGVNPKTGKRFVVQSLEGGGWGGRPHEDGESGSVSICQGDVRNGTLEGIELKTPVLIEERVLRQDFGRRRQASRRARHRPQGAQPRRRALEPRRQEPRIDAALGHPRRQARRHRVLSPAHARRERFRREERLSPSRARGQPGDRAHRRRRRLGRSLGARPRRSALGRDRGLRQHEGGARRLRRRARCEDARSRCGGDARAARVAQGGGVAACR